MTTYSYNYDRQFEKHIAQFLRIFSGFQYTKDKEGNTERIPVVYGTMDRITASILNRRRNFPNNKLPVIAGNLTGIDKNPEQKRATDYSGETPLKFSEDGNYTTLRRLIGPAFILNMSVYILASSNEQLFEILEQILLVFNPRVTIQKSDDVTDQNYNTEVILDSIQDEINYPLGTESRVVAINLTFSFNVRLNYPKTFDGAIIEKIKANLFDSTFINDPQPLHQFEIDDEEDNGEEDES